MTEIPGDTRGERKRARRWVVVASAVSIASLLVVGITVGIDHSARKHQRAEFRAALELIARANCRELAVVREASLARAHDSAQRAVILRFYLHVEAPIDDALEKLGKPPC